MYNDYMYGVERSNEYLAHYGIMGMKWGVRKAIKSGNSAKLSKQYAKASKKLAKLEKRAANSGKYAKRAAALGVGAAAAGGLAAAGTGGISKLYRGAGKAVSGAVKGGGNLLYNAGVAADKVAYKLPLGKAKNAVGGIGRSMRKSGMELRKTGVGSTAANINTAAVKGANAISRWGKSTSISNAMIGANGKAINALGNKGAGAAALGKANRKLAGVSNNTIARIGAGAVGGALAVGAAKNAYRAATAKKKAAKFKSEMNKAFAGTKYANGGARQGKKRRK